MSIGVLVDQVRAAYQAYEASRGRLARPLTHGVRRTGAVAETTGSVLRRMRRMVPETQGFWPWQQLRRRGVLAAGKWNRKKVHGQ